MFFQNRSIRQKGFTGGGVLGYVGWGIWRRISFNFLWLEVYYCFSCLKGNVIILKLFLLGILSFYFNKQYNLNLGGSLGKICIFFCRFYGVGYGSLLFCNDQLKCGRKFRIFIMIQCVQFFNSYKVSCFGFFFLNKLV